MLEKQPMLTGRSHNWRKIADTHWKNAQSPPMLRLVQNPTITVSETHTKTSQTLSSSHCESEKTCRGTDVAKIATKRLNGDGRQTQLTQPGRRHCQPPHTT